MNEGKALYVNTLNYNANDLTELRKLSDSNPELAHKIVDNQDRRNQREANSYRIALMVAGFVALALVAGGSFVLVGLGWIQTISFVLVLLGVSHVINTVLKGEFSDTSWFGAFIRGKQQTPPEE